MRDLAKRYFACTENRFCLSFLCIPIFVLFFFIKEGDYSFLRYFLLLAIIGIVDLLYQYIKYCLLRFEIKSGVSKTCTIKIIEYKKVKHHLGYRHNFESILYGYLITTNIGKKRTKLLYLLKKTNSTEEEKVIKKILSRESIKIEYYPKTKVAFKIN